MPRTSAQIAVPRNLRLPCVILGLFPAFSHVLPGSAYTVYCIISVLFPSEQKSGRSGKKNKKKKKGEKVQHSILSVIVRTLETVY